MSVGPHLAAISRLDAMFERSSIEYWIFGGWAVDFHAGRLTRDHADIDVAIWQTDLDLVHGLLVADGWAHLPVPEHDGFTSYTGDGLDLDLAFLARGSTTPHTRPWSRDAATGRPIRSARTFASWQARGPTSLPFRRSSWTNPSSATTR
jgi:hypothetical protein